MNICDICKSRCVPGQDRVIVSIRSPLVNEEGYLDICEECVHHLTVDAARSGFAEVVRNRLAAGLVGAAYSPPRVGSCWEFESYDFRAVEKIKAIDGLEVVFESGNKTSVDHIRGNNWREIENIHAAGGPAR